MTLIHPNTHREIPEPVVGEDVYVPTSLYLSHGVDDFQGGVCRITKIIEQDIPENPINSLFISVAERPGHQYNWFILYEQQAELRERHGDKRGYPDPDYSPESNEWW